MTTAPVVWFTGLPASGKSTLARGLHDRLAARGQACLVLDSDELRDALGAHAYTPAERDRFYDVVARLAALVASQGVIALVAATASRRAYRDAARARVPVFVEVWVDASLEACEARDPKGLYGRARAGEAGVRELPGITAPYEPPLAPEVTAHGGEDELALAALLAILDHAPCPSSRGVQRFEAMTLHRFNVSVGDQVFVDGNLEEVGAVRQVAKDHFIIYIENSGDFQIRGPAVKSAHDGKLVLEPTQLDAELTAAIAKAHEHESA